MALRSAGPQRAGRGRAALALAVAAGLCVLLSAGGQGCPRPRPFPSFELVALDLSRVYAMDGDSVGYEGTEIRLLGMDAPEPLSPYYEGDQEPHASEATAYLAEILRKADRLEVICLDEYDKYNRPLGYVLADGMNVNAEMVRAGLAYENVTFYGHQGLPSYADEVLEVARTAPEPGFEPPHIWRNKHRKSGR